MALTATRLLPKTLAGFFWYSKSGVEILVVSLAVDDLSVDRHSSCVLEDVVQIVGSTIRRLREERGISQEEFAYLAGLDRSFYGRIERGKQNIALKTLCLVAAHLKVHPAVLLKDIVESDGVGSDGKLLKPSGR